ncbi:MAG: biotin--[Bacteroidaceae bacterium]|nr:biotin--[acetyl-CoA-carboxylase] ligase [Bacteroidaceae bacterium]
PATSLALETGREEDRERLLDEVLSAFEALYRSLGEGQYEDIRRDYHERLYLRGERRRFEDASGVFEGCISHVEHDGHLIIEDAGGKARRYAFKEVKVKL